MNYWWAVLLALIVGSVLWKLGIPGIGAELEGKSQTLQTTFSSTLSPTENGVAVIADREATYFSITLENKGAAALELLPKSTSISIEGRQIPLMSSSRILTIPAGGKAKLLSLLDDTLYSAGQKVSFTASVAYLDTETRTPHLETYPLSVDALPAISSLSLDANVYFNNSIADTFTSNGTVSSLKGTPKLLVAILENDDEWKLLDSSTARLVPSDSGYTFTYSSSPYLVSALDKNDDGSTTDEFLGGVYGVRLIATDDYGAFAFTQGFGWVNKSLIMGTQPLA